MNRSDKVTALFRDRLGFLALVTERLGRHPTDFPEALAQIKAATRSASPRKAAGVLVPLFFSPTIGNPPGKGSFVFQLIKRSATVPQPGDLSCPGGMMHPFIDRLLHPLLVLAPYASFRKESRRPFLYRDRKATRVITLFLTTALREAWEEIRLTPWKAHFLGPLPTYSLALFRRTIFPLCAFVEPHPPFHPNGEVEKMIQIPLSSFYREENLGCYRITGPESMASQHRSVTDHPCLFHREADGHEEVLWGATFHILVTFLEVAANYRLPDWQRGRVLTRAFPPHYLTGKSSPSTISLDTPSRT